MYQYENELVFHVASFSRAEALAVTHHIESCFIT